MELNHWPIEKFIEYDRNPRKNDHAVDKMAAGIREYGFRVPMLAKSDGLVVDGHLRLKAARKLGLEALPVVLCDDMSETQIRAFRLSVNRLADEADWDFDFLKLEVEDLKAADFDLGLTGFDAEELDFGLDGGHDGSLQEWDASALEMSCSFEFMSPVKLQAKIRNVLQEHFPEITFVESFSVQSTQ